MSAFDLNNRAISLGLEPVFGAAGVSTEAGDYVWQADGENLDLVAPGSSALTIYPSGSVQASGVLRAGSQVSIGTGSGSCNLTAGEGGVLLVNGEPVSSVGNDPIQVLAPAALPTSATTEIYAAFEVETAGWYRVTYQLEFIGPVTWAAATDYALVALRDADTTAGVPNSFNTVSVVTNRGSEVATSYVLTNLVELEAKEYQPLCEIGGDLAYAASSSLAVVIQRVA